MSIDKEFIENKYDSLLDLRIDYAFKIIFAKPENKSALISLLNSIFEHKCIKRTISDLHVENPFLERESPNDKLSTLDILATLSDRSTVSIEMHLYGPTEFKYKVVRNWAKIYGNTLLAGEKYSSLHPVICISFINFPIRDHQQNPLERVHTLFQIMERNGHETLTSDMEIHFLNMKQFIIENPNRNNLPDLFSKWMSVITHKEARDKQFLKELCEQEEEINMAVETLSRFSKDQLTRLYYEKRQDDIYFYQMEQQARFTAEQQLIQMEQEKHQMEQEKHQMEQEKRLAEERIIHVEKEKHQIEKEKYQIEKEKLLAKEQAEEMMKVTLNAVKALAKENYSIEAISKMLQISECLVKGYLEK